MDCSPPGSSVHGTLQAAILEWVAISFSRVSYSLLHWRASSLPLASPGKPSKSGGRANCQVFVYSTFSIFASFIFQRLQKVNIQHLSQFKPGQQTSTAKEKAGHERPSLLRQRVCKCFASVIHTVAWQETSTAMCFCYYRG